MFIQFQKKHMTIRVISMGMIFAAVAGICVLLRLYGIDADHQRMEALVAENNSLKMSLNAVNELKRQNQELKSVLELNDMWQDMDYVTAAVVYSDASDLCSTIIVNKGTGDGIDTGMNVVADGGLVGIVSKTWKHWSEVETLHSPQLRVEAVHAESGGHVVVSAGAQDKINAQWLQYYTKVHYHETLVTSYTSDRFLSGIYIGYVDAVHKDTDNFSLTADIVPAAKLSKLEYVVILKKTKEALLP